MADSADTMPVMTDEQRRKNLEKAAAARKERKALLDLVREGSVTFGQASADPRYWRIPVVRLLVAVPGVGKAKATQLMTEAGISPRVGSRVSVAGSASTSSGIFRLTGLKRCSRLDCSSFWRRLRLATPPPSRCSFAPGWRRGCDAVSHLFDLV